MAFTWSGISAARARLEKLARGLEQVAGGAVLARAVAKVAEQIRAVAADKLGKHELSGAAAALTVVDQSGGLITLHGMPPRNGKTSAGKSYLSMYGWWPFRRGSMPPFVVTRAAQIFANEVLLALGGRGTALGSLAGEVVDEGAAGAAKRASKALAQKHKTEEAAAARKLLEPQQRDKRGHFLKKT